MIRQEWIYPREDIVELRMRVQTLENTAQHLTEQLNPEEPHSLAAHYQHTGEETRRDLARLGAALEELRAMNQTDHDRLSREFRN
jgi:hypothetical protein